VFFACGAHERDSILCTCGRQSARDSLNTVPPTTFNLMFILLHNTSQIEKRERKKEVVDLMCSDMNGGGGAKKRGE
jgi:hypothetical protein